MPKTFDWNGHQISEARWLHLFANPALRWALRTPVSRGREVITTWFGVAHRPGDPLFETTLERATNPANPLARRIYVELATYASRAEAEAGHTAWVAVAGRGPVPGELEAVDHAMAEGLHG